MVPRFSLACTLVIGLAFGSYAAPCNRPGLEQEAFRNDVEAQFLLARCLAAMREFPAAFAWYVSAAQQDHAGAQLELAWMYENGSTTVRDKPAALHWMERAAAADDLDAVQDLELLQKRYADEEARLHSYRLYTILVNDLKTKRQNNVTPD